MQKAYPGRTKKRKTNMVVGVPQAGQLPSMEYVNTQVFLAWSYVAKWCQNICLCKARDRISTACPHHHETTFHKHLIKNSVVMCVAWVTQLFTFKASINLCNQTFLSDSKI